MYEFWERAYINGWATKEQLKQAVKKGYLTIPEYEKITKEVYVETT